MHSARSTIVRNAPPSVQTQNRPYKAIVVVFMSGGVDSWNMLMPHSGCKNPEGNPFDLFIAEISGAQASAKNLNHKIHTLDQESLRQQELVYNAEFQIQQMERKVARAGGERSDEEKIALNARNQKRLLMKKNGLGLRSGKYVMDALEINISPRIEEVLEYENDSSGVSV